MESREDWFRLPKHRIDYRVGARHRGARSPYWKRRGRGDDAAELEDVIEYGICSPGRLASGLVSG